MRRYLYNHQVRAFCCETIYIIIYTTSFTSYDSPYGFPLQNKDGGWGVHIEGQSTMFGTTLNYVTLRLLGEGAEDGKGAMEKACKWILDHGGATAITSWGKMWLSV